MMLEDFRLSVNILAFAGSNRTHSVNRKLVEAAARLGQEYGARVRVINLKDYPLPLYDGDLEAADGVPAALGELKHLIASHDALLIASPEYNASVTAVLKNTIDWLSRPSNGGAPGAELKGKVVGLLSASPGGLGGICGLNHLRAIFQNLSAFVIPNQFALGAAHAAFAEDGTLKEQSARNATLAVVQQLIETARRLTSAS
jgi:NAD(P)H-dependent FMN reductase